MNTKNRKSSVCIMLIEVKGGEDKSVGAEWNAWIAGFIIHTGKTNNKNRLRLLWQRRFLFAFLRL